MKVLVIDEWFPWPLESGKKIRTFNLISGLAKWHNIIYLAFASLPIEKEKIGLMRAQRINAIPVQDTRQKKWTLPFYWDVARNMFSCQAFSTEYHIKENFAKELCKIVQDEKPDLVHCEWTNYAPYLRFVDCIPTVISSHNIESDIWLRLAHNTRNPIKKFVALQQARKIEVLEKEWYARVNHVIAVSESDKIRIERYGGNASVVDNGVDIAYYDMRGIIEDDDSIVYAASYDTFANQDAVHYFMSEIYPHIKSRAPSLKVSFVGKDPPASIRKYEQKNMSVHVTGTVPDIREYVQRASVVVVPLRIGGGSRIKILEAMAMKKPVVSTSVGAEGLKVIDGENIFIADDPIMFSNKVLNLLRDKKLRYSLGMSGWERVRDVYDWNELIESHDKIWHEVATPRCK
jgi:glycosyltransferase involved in cell wall biosynthesis